MNLAKNFEEILHAFNDSNVDYIIVGGYAVIFHGYGRTTGDLDIWINATLENQKVLIEAFRLMKYGENQIQQLERLDFTKPFSFKVGDGLFVVDILNFISGINFEECKKHAILYQYSSNLNVKFLHLHDLIRNKMSTGRMKDLADVEELQHIHNFTKEKRFFDKLKSFFKKE